MPKHHLVLTEEEFNQLKQMELTSIDQLSLEESEKASLLKQAQEKHNNILGVNPNAIPIVICGFVDDAVVCVVLRPPFGS